MGPWSHSKVGQKPRETEPAPTFGTLYEVRHWRDQRRDTWRRRLARFMAPAC